jgi:nucleotide-binding universal stress UspA family protein
MIYQFKSIAVAIDFSNCSLRALDVAAAQAKRLGAQLHLLYVLDGYTYNGSEEITKEKLSQTTSVLRDAVLHRFDLVPVVVELAGSSCEAITEWCRRNPCDLLVVGTHGWSGSREYHIGTTAYSITKFSSCPVLLIPASVSSGEFRKALFALRPAAGMMNLVKLTRLLLADNASVEIQPHQYRMQGYSKNICRMIEETGDKPDGIEIEWTARWGSGEAIAQETVSASRCIKADLLVLTPSLGRMSRIGFVDPEVQQILNTADVPILYLMNCQLFSTERKRENLSAF